MDTQYSSSTLISVLLEGLIPFKGSFSTACNALIERNCHNSRFAGEELFEASSEPVHFLGSWGHQWESLFSLLELLIRDQFIGIISYSINPGISNTVTQLFLLSPEDIRGNIWVFWSIKGLS